MKTTFKRHGRAFLLPLLAGMLISTSPLHAAMKCHKDLVCDGSGLISEAQIANIETYHKALLEGYDMDYRIVVMSVQGDIAQEAVNTFKKADIGARSKTKKGILLLLDPQSNKVRLEISAGLDAVYTDGFVAYLQQRQMVPFFKAGRVADGILATTEMIITRAQEAQEGKEFIPPEQLPDNLAIGAGAQTNADIGKGYSPAKGPSKLAPKAQGMTPEQVVTAYHYTLEKGMTDPDLDIYSKATKALRKKWVVTPAQMKNELKAYKKCDIDKTVYTTDNMLAVVRYKVDQRKCAPYFLVMENGSWRLDFVTMMQNIRFNVSNDWHLDMKRPLPYADAFLDWDFNKDGYPFPQRKLRWGLNINTNYRNNQTTVHKIFPGTPAESMQLQEGDIILSWDGIKNPDHRQVIKSMDTVKEGKSMLIEIVRNGQKLTVTLKAPPKV